MALKYFFAGISYCFNIIENFLNSWQTMKATQVHHKSSLKIEVLELVEMIMLQNAKSDLKKSINIGI